MDHPAPAPELASPWRTATLVATAVASLELVLLVLAGTVLLGRSIAPHLHKAAERRALAPPVAQPVAIAQAAPGATAKPEHHAKPKPMLPRARTQILVLNGNGVAGAAAQASALATARGYVVKEVGNAPRTGYARTMVMYGPGLRREAARFAHDLELSAVSPLDGMKPTQLHGAQLVEILGDSR
jgi:hypothetical protein